MRLGAVARLHREWRAWIAHAAALLYGMLWRLLSAVGRCRGFRNRWSIERVSVVLLHSVDCACAADARGGATSALACSNSHLPLVLNFGFQVVLSFSMFGC